VSGAVGALDQRDVADDLGRVAGRDLDEVVAPAVRVADLFGCLGCIK